jgi:prepilin peptidase CpaA
MNKILFGVSLVCVITAAVTDYRVRRIPNWLTLPSMLSGLVLNGVFLGWSGLLLSLKGLGLGFLLLFLWYLLGGMGAGDVKLLSAVGAILGPRLVFFAFIWTAIVGGVIAVTVMICKRSVMQTFRNLWILIQTWVIAGSHREANITIRNQSLIKLPYGVAIAFGTGLAVWLQWIPGLEF